MLVVGLGGVVGGRLTGLAACSCGIGLCLSVGARQRVAAFVLVGGIRRLRVRGNGRLTADTATCQWDGPGLRRAQDR